MSYEAAIFDLDGTLLDSYAAIHESLNEVLRTFGREPVSLRDVRKMVGHGLPALIEKAVGAENVEEGTAIFEERYAEIGAQKTELMPGAEFVTRELEKRGVSLGVVSNKPSLFSDHLLDALGLGERFAIVVGPDDGFDPKPDPAMVLVALDELGVSPAEAIYVGDMPLDVAMARAAGMAVAVLPTGSSGRQELLDAKPDHVLGSLSELLTLF